MLVADRFRIDGSLGQGGMGEVYRAWDRKLARAVALKWIRADQRSDASVTGRFLREARAAAALRHPNIVAVHDLGEDAGALYIVMELVDGRPLRSVIGDAAVPIVQRLVWLEQIASALAAAHAAGLVHRDVKPSNVMIGADGHVKVLDFGLAKRTELAPPHGGPRETGVVPSFRTEHGMVLGTPTYMAPEQARGEQVDARADQYAWGLVAYELLLGRRWSPTMPNEPPPPNPLIAEVWPVLRRATQPDPGARFPSMTDILAELGRVRTGVRAAPPTMTLTASSAAKSLPAPSTMASPAPTFTSPPPSMPMSLPPAAGPPMAPAAPARGALFAAIGAVATLAVIGLLLVAFVLGRRTAAQPVDATTDASTPVAAVTASAPVAPPSASSAHLASTPPRHSAPAATPSSPPKTPGRMKYGGELSKGNFLATVEFFPCPACDWDAWYATLQKTRAPFAACYTNTMYVAPYHTFVRFQIDVAADGQFTGIRQLHPDAQNVALDTCVLQALSTNVPLKKTGGGPGKLVIQLYDDCVQPVIDGERRFDRCE